MITQLAWDVQRDMCGETVADISLEDMCLKGLYAPLDLYACGYCALVEPGAFAIPQDQKHTPLAPLIIPTRRPARTRTKP